MLYIVIMSHTCPLFLNDSMHLIQIMSQRHHRHSVQSVCLSYCMYVRTYVRRHLQNFELEELPLRAQFSPKLAFSKTGLLARCPNPHFKTPLHTQLKPFPSS
jgi:hypothetical protein